VQITKGLTRSNELPLCVQYGSEGRITKRCGSGLREGSSRIAEVVHEVFGDAVEDFGPE